MAVFGCCHSHQYCVRTKKCAYPVPLTGMDPRTRETVVLLDPADCQLKKRWEGDVSVMVDTDNPISPAKHYIDTHPLRDVPFVENVQEPVPNKEPILLAKEDAKDVRARLRRRMRSRERRK